ncbi:hypothetical protein [Singulisphaera sp. PoT]|uniref:hypothetical protein n=1 Tax=Singulisphaera sp. PoT TaxID=3411797 RepID=UPI003BF60C37
MFSAAQVAAFLGALATAQARQVQRRRPIATKQSFWSRWLSEPRNAVFLLLATSILFGGGRKLHHAWRARKAVGRLYEDNLDEAAILQTSEFGRAGVIDLFRILGTGETERIRNAAGQALARLWAQDELVKEEEIALVRRGFQVNWKARRRYPRALDAPLPIRVTYGIPFLEEGGQGISPEQLEWSHRIIGARRAALEEFSPWRTGLQEHLFTLIPTDFETNGPHKLVLQVRVRTVGLTESWEIELPHMPFQFEFDPRLAPESLFAQHDSARVASMNGALGLNEVEPDDEAPARYLSLNDELAIRNPPMISIAPSLASDLAHQVEVAFEGVEGTFRSGSVILSTEDATKLVESEHQGFELTSFEGFPIDAIERPGTLKMKLLLKANPHLGWAEPSIRSIWPGTIETRWVEVRVVRR